MDLGTQLINVIHASFSTQFTAHLIHDWRSRGSSLFLNVVWNFSVGIKNKSGYKGDDRFVVCFNSVFFNYHHALFVLVKKN